MLKKLIFSAFFFAPLVEAKVSVLATVPDLGALATEIGAEWVDVQSFCKGSQDPHFLEAKPSYMLSASKADLVLAIGLGLEIAWLPKVLTGGRNPKIMPGAKGYLELGPLVEVLEKPEGKISRADGDVHPEGNPHVTLDPIRLGTMAVAIGEKLAELDNAHAAVFRSRAAAIKERLNQKSVVWAKRIAATGISSVVTYHKTLSYFLNRYSIKNAAILEPLPGVPPTAPHILSVIQKAKAEGVKLVLVENTFSDAVAKRVAADVKDLRISSIPVAVGGAAGIDNADQLFEAIVKAFEAK